MELRVDFRATRASMSAQRMRIGEALAFLMKRKVEARQRGGGGGAGMSLGVGRVMTL